jgi:alkylation response protein AidB-like acyl-CoA dehydrogenase
MAIMDVMRTGAFELTDDQKAVGELARDLAQSEIAPHIAAWDRDHTFPEPLYATFAEAGLMGIVVPEEFGGAGLDYVSYALAIEEIARVDAGTATTLSVHTMITAAINTLGNDAQRAQWLPKLATGTIGGFGLTEPDAGSDAAAIRGRARRDGNEYVLSGRKQWCTNGGYAGVTMAMFRTSDDRVGGISSFLVPNATPGVYVEKVTDKLGIRTSNTVDLAFDDARVSADALLGNEGDGLRRALATLAAGRIGIAAQATGILAACLDASVKFAKERMSFGKPIGAHQAIGFKIAQMAMDLDAARLLVYRAAALRDAGKPFAVEASKAKLFASTAAREHASEAVQIHGGYGYTTEFPVERYYRDAKITEIYEGTSEVQHIIIARSLLGRLDD